MTRRFQVGDRVRIVYALPEFAHLIGVVTHILSVDRADPKAEYRLDIGGGHHWCRGSSIEPVSDGDEKLSWSDERVVWKPRAIA